MIRRGRFSLYPKHQAIRTVSDRSSLIYPKYEFILMPFTIFALKVEFVLRIWREPDPNSGFQVLF